MRIRAAVATALLTLTLSACAGGVPGLEATPSTGSVSASPASASGATSPQVAEIVDGVVVNQLDVLELPDAQVMMRDLSAQGGVVASHDSRIGTYLVWFPTHSLAEITKIKETLIRQGISANLVLAHPPLN